MKYLLTALVCLIIVGLIYMEWIPQPKMAVDYQIVVFEDTTILKDMQGKEVGRVKNTWKSPLDTLIMKDNE